MPRWNLVYQPRTRRQLQVACNAAAGALALESCRLYGLLEGGPGVDVARCEEVLARAAARGIRPAPDAVDRFFEAIIPTRGGSER